MMEIKVSFAGGPLHGQTAMTNDLSQVKMFFPKARQILLYVRENETLYVYDIIKSKGLEARYDEAFKRFAPKDDEKTLRFVLEGETRRMPKPPAPFRYIQDEEPEVVDEDFPGEYREAD